MVDNDFVNMVKELQKKIEYGEEKTYSKTVINEYRNPTHFGVLKHPDSIGQIKGSCGDTMKFTLKIVKDVIEDASFWTDGCGATVAAGNMLTKMIMRKTLKEANNVTSEQLLGALDGLPNEHRHCAHLAIKTMHKSIENYRMKI